MTEKSAHTYNLISRLFSLGIIWIGTTIAGILLSMQVGGWLAVVVGIFSICGLYIAARSYIKPVRQVLLDKQQ